MNFANSNRMRKWTTFRVLILLVTLGFSTVSWSYSCPEIFKLHREKGLSPEQYLSRYPLDSLHNSFTGKDLEAEVVTDFRSRKKVISVIVDGVGLASITFKVSRWFSSTVLKIIHVDVANAIKDQRVSTYLLARALAEYPDVNVIKSMLSDENFKAYREAPKGSDEEALKSTPAYRIRARFGFTEIKNFKDGFMHVRGFTVTKPPAKVK